MNSIYSSSEISLIDNLSEALSQMSTGFPEGKIFLIFDTHTWEYCWPLVRGFRPVPEMNILILEAGEDNKNIGQVTTIWEILGRKGADRSSLVIVIGGGMLTDLAGFAAGTFKRGLTVINVPTTLLAMVDASAGGKTGINFRGLKNEIGVIRQPKHVFLHLPFLKTLDRENLLSGYAEMLKAGLIADSLLWLKLKEFKFDNYSEEELGSLIWRSVMIKNDIVQADPEERGIRKSLNFGHTVGHALESECMHAGTPLPHGYAVAYGMVVEAILSHDLLGFPMESVAEISETISRLYGNPPDTLKNTEVLLHWMKFDKKNHDNRINFSLLDEIGKCRVNVDATEEEIAKAFRL